MPYLALVDGPVELAIDLVRLVVGELRSAFIVVVSIADWEFSCRIETNLGSVLDVRRWRWRKAVATLDVS
jgi:hypothetical protein